MSKIKSPLIVGLVKRCIKNHHELGFPEADDARVLTAAHQLLSLEIIKTAHFFQPQEQVAAKHPGLAQRLSAFSGRCQWHAAGPSNPLVAAAERLARGELAAVIAGCVYTTAEVCKTAIRNVGLDPRTRLLSSCFLMERTTPRPELLLFADAGVVIEPTAEQLAAIATASSQTWQKVCPDREPVVAFLSFSTKGSASHDRVSVVTKATLLFRASNPGIRCDGELQFDAAYNAEVAARKCAGSEVAGAANCFIFPNLDAANIAYKIAQRLAGFSAFGPILQGVRRPFSDLSRGASADDIVASSVINLALAGP